MVASHVYASVTPTLSLYATSDGNTVQMNVTGDPSVSVMFYYTKIGVSQQQIASLGNTDSSGSFSGTISSSLYGIVTGSPVHVTLNGINGPASSVVSWPTVTTTSNNNQISFSQTSLTLAVGQANTITVANNTSGSSLYISNNSSPSVANVNLLNGNQITVTGNLYGSTVVTVCSTGTVACGTFSVAVNSTGTSGGTGTLIISQSNPIIAVGQSTNIVVSGGTGSGYYISSNSNPSILQTNLANNVLTITALVNGYSSINICDSANNCGQVVVTVSYSSNSNPIILSQTSLSIAVGQSSSVTLTGGVTPYNLPISSNSIYQASLNGNSLNINGVSAGTAQVLVCSAGGGCSTLSVVVTGSSSNYSALTFSQNNISLIPGQNTTVSISGTGSYYISNNSNSNVAGAIISGNNIMISSVGSGTSNINVCQSGGQCAILYVTVSTVNSSLYTGTSFLSLNQSNTSVYIGQTTTVSISGSSVYTVTYNSNPSIVSTNISGSVLSLTGAKNGYAVIVVCDSSNNCSYSISSSINLA